MVSIIGMDDTGGTLQSSRNATNCQDAAHKGTNVVWPEREVAQFNKRSTNDHRNGRVLVESTYAHNMDG